MSSFFFLSQFIDRFSVRLRELQHEIKSPYFPILHRFLHFAFIKSQAIPNKILNVLIHLDQGRTRGLFVIGFGE